MSFLNPIMLFGLAAVSVPIIIHLLNRRRVERVVWAAMRFLKVSVEQNQRRIQIEDLILLALRCLLLAVLALALARPAIQRGAPILGTSRSTAVLLIDNSYSMDMSDGTETRFDKARRSAELALNSLGIGSAAAIWFVSDTVQSAIPEPTLDLNLARKAIRQGTLTDRGTDFLPALTRAVEVLRGRFGMSKHIYIFTDGQAAGWQPFNEVLKVCNAAEVRVHLVLVNEHETQNVAVSDLRLASGLSPTRHPLRFHARVTNFGREEARDVRVTLQVDSDPPSDEFTIGTLPSGGSQSVALFAKLGNAGFHSVTAQLRRDRLRADDRRQCVVRAINEVRVLLVSGNVGKEGREGETFFLQHALAPVNAEARSEYFIKTTSISAADLVSTPLNDFDAVVLANVAELAEQTARGLQEFVRRGGGLMVFPGDRVNANYYNEQLCDRLHLLPARLDTIGGDANQDDQFVTLQDSNYEHPVVAIWNDPASGTLGSARFFRRFSFTVGPARDGTKQRIMPATPAPVTVLKYSDKTPAVLEGSLGLGRVFLFSSTADTEWNDWPVRPSFVPMLHRTLGALVQKKDEALNVGVGENFVRNVAAEFLHKDAVMRTPRENKGAEARRIELVSEVPALRFEETDVAGIYGFEVADPPLKEMFAVQSNPSESSLDELSPTQLGALGRVAHILPWKPDLSFREEIGQAQAGAEFWIPLVLLGIALAVAEIVLGQWFSRSK